ncbi:dihydrofolate reductase [Leptospira yasudae]|uniref:dihydrofolate reductase family protein n=1 Tax=Leptospira yasudae TaxID=2202201 RepID=UPI001082B3EC|nr:dihydrofolate reductase family protein [Leptospira yasudae]TGK23193.1 dihydrofolate reductase [Leptospira yasudae]TGM00447.1 dihydrofolate reductase [Leptospira yasudae]
MKKVILQQMISLDGYFEGPQRSIDWHVVDKEFNEYAVDFLNSVDTLLFGRVTYELMAGYWTTADALRDDPIVAAKMNELRKVVYSKTLKKADWENTKLISSNLIEEIRALKNEPGKDIAIFGSSDLSVPLIEDGLIDELRIFVNPVLLGGGKPLFQGIHQRIKLKLTQTRTFRSGNVLLYYQTT